MTRLYQLVENLRSRSCKANALGPESVVRNSAVANLLSSIADDILNITDSIVDDTTRQRIAVQQIMSVDVNGIHTNSFACRKAVIEAHAIMEGKRKINKG